MGGQRDEVIAAYWHHFTLASGGREQRLAAEDSFWAWEEVRDAVEHDPVADAVTLLEQLLSAPGADPVYLGAGPLEDLLRQRPHASALIAQRCRHSAVAPHWQRAVAAVVWDEADREALVSLQPWLPQRREGLSR